MQKVVSSSLSSSPSMLTIKGRVAFDENTATHADETKINLKVLLTFVAKTGLEKRIDPELNPKD
jgi:hypothetical protein